MNNDELHKCFKFIYPETRAGVKSPLSEFCVRSENCTDGQALALGLYLEMCKI